MNNQSDLSGARPCDDETVWFPNVGEKGRWGALDGGSCRGGEVRVRAQPMGMLKRVVFLLVCLSVFHKTNGATYGHGRVHVGCNTATEVAVDIILKNKGTNDVHVRPGHAEKHGKPHMKKTTVIIEKTSMVCDKNGQEFVTGTGYCAADIGQIGDQWVWCKFLAKPDSDTHVEFTVTDRIAVSGGTRGGHVKRNAGEPSNKLVEKNETGTGMFSTLCTEAKRAIITFVGVAVMVKVPINPLWKVAIISAMKFFVKGTLL